MAKLIWRVVAKSEYGYNIVNETIEARTRQMAIATAEADWLRQNGWQHEFAGITTEDGILCTPMPMPDFQASKLGRA